VIGKHGPLGGSNHRNGKETDKSAHVSRRGNVAMAPPISVSKVSSLPSLEHCFPVPSLTIINLTGQASSCPCCPCRRSPEAYFTCPASIRCNYYGSGSTSRSLRCSKAFQRYSSRSRAIVGDRRGAFICSRAG
jgi:hypothetical protein